MRTIFATALFVIAVFSSETVLQAQERSVVLYNSIPDSLKQLVYNEEFDGSTAAWRIKYGDTASVKTEGTFLALSNTSEMGLAGAESPELTFDNSRDFEIEFLVITGPGDDVPEVRMGWGYDGARIEFDLKPRLCEYQALRITAGIEFIAEPARDFVAINRDDINRICIRRIKDKFYFFANKTLLLECRYHDIPVGTLFAGLSGKGSVRFDQIRISYLNIR